LIPDLSIESPSLRAASIYLSAVSIVYRVLYIREIGEKIGEKMREKIREKMREKMGEEGYENERRRPFLESSR
jgi:hypothetical protein